MRKLLLVLLIAVAFADGGIWHPPDVNLLQTSQKAIVIWEDGIETMILATEYNMNGSGNVVQFIPLPNKPEIREADYSLFKEVVDIFNAKQKGMFSLVVRGGIEGYGEKIEIVEKVTIKNHHFTILKVNDAEEFGSWIKSHYYGDVSSDIISALQDYVKRGYRYIVIDEIKPSNNFASAIEMRFKSDAIWYPVKITKEANEIDEESKGQIFIISKFFPTMYKSVVKVSKDDFKELKKYIHSNELYIAYWDFYTKYADRDVELVPIKTYFAIDKGELQNYEERGEAPIFEKYTSNEANRQQLIIGAAITTVGIIAGFIGYLIGRR